MNRLMKTTVAALVAGATIATAAAPASARGWGGGGHGWHGGGGGWHGGSGYRGGWSGYRGGWGGYRGGYYRDHTGAILGAGVAGLALGAVIASNNRPYYGGGGGYYRDGYYDGYGYADDCYSRRAWDPYIGRYVWTRECY